MKDEVLKYLENVTQAAIVMINSLSNEDLSWKPNFEARSVLELIWHIATLSAIDIKGGTGEFNSSEEFADYLL